MRPEKKRDKCEEDEGRVENAISDKHKFTARNN